MFGADIKVSYAVGRSIRNRLHRVRSFFVIFDDSPQATSTPLTGSFFYWIIPVVRMGFILHFYQPPMQREEVFKKIADECYVPLLKLIKDRSKSHKFTVNASLSFLEQMSKYGYETWINDLRALVMQEKIDIIGSAAYHPLLPKIKKELAEQEIILNEYALGCFLGTHHGFEGEPGVMLRNLKGFFPPELAVSDDVVDMIASLGYDWLVIDSPALGELNNQIQNSYAYVYKKPHSSLQLVVRDRNLSNMLAFKHDLSLENISEYLSREETRHDKEYHGVICLDAETFGHHNKEGIHLLSSFIDLITLRNCHLSSINDVMVGMESANVSAIYESTWADCYNGDAEDVIYSLWINTSSKTNTLMWQLDLKLQEVAINMLKDTISVNGDFVQFSSIHSNIENDKVLSILHCLVSDRFWWSSSVVLNDGTILYDKQFLEEYIEYLLNNINKSQESEQLDAINDIKSLVVDLKLTLQ